MKYVIFLLPCFGCPVEYIEKDDPLDGGKKRKETRVSLDNLKSEGDHDRITMC